MKRYLLSCVNVKPAVMQEKWENLNIVQQQNIRKSRNSHRSKIRDLHSYTVFHNIQDCITRHKGIVQYLSNVVFVQYLSNVDLYCILQDTMLHFLTKHLEYWLCWSVCLSCTRSETVVERMLCNWMSICLYQFLKVSGILATASVHVDD